MYTARQAYQLAMTEYRAAQAVTNAAHAASNRFRMSGDYWAARFIEDETHEVLEGARARLPRVDRLALDVAFDQWYAEAPLHD